FLIEMNNNGTGGPGTGGFRINITAKELEDQQKSLEDQQKSGSSITWTQYGGIVYWSGSWSSWGWNWTPGSNMWAGGKITVPPGYSKIKIVYVSGYWKRSDDIVTERKYLGIKGYINSGGFNSVISVGATGEIRVGNYSPDSGSGTILYKIYIGK
ncbi:hypothetical protein M0R19_06370, partial [Candidatus Pacearchaeota archaeon]|nr:hypothetical protein [Candidatus Pacearchaeota archaeon]